jgi:hypothetical protein
MCADFRFRLAEACSHLSKVYTMADFAAEIAAKHDIESLRISLEAHKADHYQEDLWR